MTSQTIDEQLSALLDGELPIEEQEMLLHRLDRDPELREKYARYSVIGGVLTDGELPVGAMQIADRVRDQLRDDPEPAVRRPPGAVVGSGLFGAGLAAAAALLVVLNLSPNGDDATAPQLAGVAQLDRVPATVTIAAGSAAPPSDRLRANVAPERMRRYLVTHSRYSNSAARQFVDSHVVMPAYQRAAWQTSGSVR